MNVFKPDLCMTLTEQPYFLHIKIMEKIVSVKWKELYVKVFCRFFFLPSCLQSEQPQWQQEVRKSVIITVPSGTCVWITPRTPLTWLHISYTRLTAERRESSICVCVCSRRFRRTQNTLTSIENLNDISLYSTSCGVILWELIGSWRALIKGVALFTNMEVFIRQEDFKCDINPLFIIAPLSVSCNPRYAASLWRVGSEGHRLD